MEKTLHIPRLDIPIKSIFCIGRNYSEHAKELGNAVPKEPIVFLKPLNTICFDGDTISIPSQSKDVHHEVEMVIAIGKTGKNIKQEEALDYIVGIGVGIDLTARDIQQKAKEKGLPWAIAKGFDTFAPISEFVPLVEVPSINNLDLELKVNGQVRQTGNTLNMIFSCEYLISYLSTIFTLNPGDLIFTGTPKGVSAIQTGDKIEASLNRNLANLSLSVE
tara:strand:- start:21900 stop:22556 length:657 start_codon:yes stop_codon:yes gene_type:complete